MSDLQGELDACAALEQYVDVTSSRRSTRLSQDGSSLKTSRLEHSDAIKKNKVKSDLKRSTAFIKKIKSNLTIANLGIVVSDIQTLNLTRHTTEVAQALFDAKIKPVDSSAAVTLIIEMNTRYKDFLPAIVQLYAAALKNEKDSKKSKDKSPPLDPKEKGRIRRMGIRILTELALSAGAGTNDEFAPLDKMLLKFISDAAGAPSKTNQDPKEQYNVADVNVLLSFVR